MSSRILSGSGADGVRPWELPDIEKPEPRAGINPDPVESGPGAASSPSAASLMTAEQLEEIQRQAHDEGFSRGREEGRTEGLREMREKAQTLTELISALSEPFADLDHEVEEQLIALTTALTRQLVRREVKTDPRYILAAVRQAMSVLPAASREARVHLHPEDANLLRETLSLAEQERSWEIAEDPALSRGDCRVSSDTSQIDARLDSRLNTLISGVFGDERVEDALE